MDDASTRRVLDLLRTIPLVSAAEVVHVTTFRVPMNSGRQLALNVLDKGVCHPLRYSAELVGDQGHRLAASGAAVDAPAAVTMLLHHFSAL